MLRSKIISRLLLHNPHQLQQPLVFSLRSISQVNKLSRPRHSKVRHASAARHQKKVEESNDVVAKTEAVSELSSTLNSSTISTTTLSDDLKFDEPPVLFIRKYEEFIDIKNITVRDELSDMEKNGTLTPNSLTYEKIQFIQSAVKTSHTIKQFTEALKKQPDPLHAPVTAVNSETQKKSVFVDSDFEVIKPDPGTRSSSSPQLSLAKYETELEWSTARTVLAKLPSHYLMLSKSRLTLLVCLTAGAGYGMAPAEMSLMTALMATLGTAMASAAANTINQILEVPFDSQMSRTKNRVLVRGQVTPLHAATFAGVLASSSTLLLYTLVHPITAALSLFNLVLYTSVYTPMKRYSILNTWVGSVVGAVPPLIGWTAATGSLDLGAFVLAGVLYTWQFPHFNSLSWNLRPDYSRAGYRMMSVTHPDLCRRVAVRHSLALIAVCSAAPLLEVTHWAFALESLPLNLYMVYLSWRFYQRADSSSSRKLFRYTLIHLPLLMTLMCLGKKSKDKEKEEASKMISSS